MAPVSTGALEIPLEIIDRFRARALERIGVLEAHWQGLTSRETADPRAVEDMRREIHTLKGDARVVGFIDASLLSHKLEELLAAAHRLDYRVAGDFDPVVTRGFRFLAALVREGAGGIDLDGFLVEAERVLRGAGPVPLPDEHQPTSQPHRDRLGLETRLAMAAAATAVFLEHLSASGRSRERLYGAWRALSGQLAAIGAVGLRALVAPHTESVTRLAADLGKSVDVEVDVADGSVAAEAAEAIDAALRQVLHGAVSHGLEAPEARRLAGKRPDGRIALRVRLRPSGIEIEVEDDGAGLDVSAIRRRAVERGLIAERPAASASHDELVELLFQPGFSTSRGAGLHAVRA
ncbi:MAG TPA: Hpt domain-containing protein, partial [Kofleriaceae bacterium]|nr:Hpt domain-containing protein [Kofleriaceae bacterium]